MSIPVICKGCSEVVGNMHALAYDPGNFDATYFTGPCPGKGKHPAPRRDESLQCFGWVKRVYLYYPETGDALIWYEYAGPPSRIAAFIAVWSLPWLERTLCYKGSFIRRDGFRVWGDGLDKLLATSK